jgi:hypothetical protein
MFFPAATCSAILVAGGLISPLSALAGKLPATGQTTAYQARNNGDAAPVAVPDDGTLQRGATLLYEVLQDGTVKDLHTGLIWEVKCTGGGCAALHDVANTYPWSGDGSTDTIWDWLADINAEGGTGYAGHNDWRIPNVRELQSIADYGVLPTIAPLFGPTSESEYWSSTAFAPNPSAAEDVDFFGGDVRSRPKSTAFFVRAVRHGPK